MDSVETVLDIILIVYGSAMLILNFFKPSWYWNYHRMQRRRKLIGDEGASRMNYFFGALLLGVGLVMRLGIL